MNRLRRRLAAVLVVVAVAASAPAVAQMPGPGKPVTGVVLNPQGRPAPGLAVQLLHPQMGPSTISVTTPAGIYYFGYVPSNVTAPYVVEVRWGTQVIYRDYLRQLGQQAPIHLKR